MIENNITDINPRNELIKKLSDERHPMHQAYKENIEKGTLNQWLDSLLSDEKENHPDKDI